jgi:Skp family chaperone for outer membrane proteins
LERRQAELEKREAEIAAKEAALKSTEQKKLDELMAFRRQ